jgi:hypothetical protein
MTPKEKARQLIEDFNYALTLKDCALITVNEILDYENEFLKNEFQFNYWKQVQQEIKKL